MAPVGLQVQNRHLDAATVQHKYIGGLPDATRLERGSTQHGGVRHRGLWPHLWAEGVCAALAMGASCWRGREVDLRPHLLPPSQLPA